MGRKRIDKILARDTIIFILDHFGLLSREQIARAFKISREGVRQILKKFNK